MYYEIKNKQLWQVTSGKVKPECIFCGKTVNFGDYFCLCKKHGDEYYKISKFLRVLLPKFIIKVFI